ncbi:hypothetical protein Q4R22_10680 [Morganella morganii subsp. sibonii]
MKKIGDVTSTADKNGEWTNGNVAAGIAPTILEAGWLNSVQREILGVLTKAGIQQDKNNDTQLAEAISKIISGGDYATKTEVNSKLAKDQNGADIPNKDTFIKNLGLLEKFADKKRFDTNGSFTLMFSEDRKFSLQLGNHGYLTLYNLALDKTVMSWSPSGELVSGVIGFDRVSELKSAAKKDVGNGVGQIPDMSFFPLSGIGTDNLIATFPNGLIIQVFKRTLANKAAAGEIETIPLSYPMAFPRGAAAVFCTKTSYAQTLVSCENTTATGFSAVTVKVFESAGATLSTANFLAIGWQ